MSSINTILLITPAFYTAARIINVLLLIAFLSHLLVRFWNKRVGPFFLPWVLFWGSLIAQYLFVETVEYLNARTSLSLFLLTTIALLNSLFLLVAAELSLQRNFTPKLLISEVIRGWLKWSIPYAVLVGISLLVTPYWALIVVNYASFLSIALYTGRYTAIFPETKQWIIIVLYIYAGFNLHALAHAGESELIFLIVTYSFVIPLKIVFYYTGYLILLRKSSSVLVSNEHSPPDENPARTESTDKTKVSPPEPTVGIQFTGMWGFLYILWRYPSGKVVVMFMFAVLMSAIAVLSANLVTLVSILKQALNK